jgi:DNA gyrase subunit A
MGGGEVVIQQAVQHERILPRLIEQEMRDSFIDYSMSVIVQRALPDARDGLKPVHRRILFAMHELGLMPGRDYKKSATVVGDVLGKYHPHGDSAVYDTLVRMVQEFSLRYPLIDGQGNFGSIDGDSAAAYRYTEARLAPIALDLLSDLDKDTVDFIPNFDGRLTEPAVMPTRLPNLLLNGSDGIAVGMATKIPPHNARELLAAAEHLIRNPDCSLDELIALVPGPDFPTGAFIWGRSGIEDAYRKGRGLIDMRARVHLEEGSRGKKALVITELPYQVNKTRVIEQIAKAVKGRGGEAISDLRDESDRDGIRLVVELKREVDTRKLIKFLFKKTQLRSTYGVIMLALRDGRPEQLNLKEALECFVSHRLEVVRRRAAFQLGRSEARKHIVEGLLLALDDSDRVIDLIRRSRTPDSARTKLRKELSLTEPQAEAILAMRLARLTGLERKKLDEELEALRTAIEEYEGLVEDETARRDYLCAELAELAARYGDERRTEILKGEGSFPLPEGDGAESSIVMLSRLGYIKSQAAGARSGMAGAEAMAARDADFVRQAFIGRGSDTLLALTRLGHAHAIPVKELPRGTRSSRGHRLRDFIELDRRDAIVSVLPVEDFDESRYLVVFTEQGQVKRTSLSEYANIRAGGIIAAGLGKGDRVVTATVTDGNASLVLATSAGQAIRFAESEVRPMGRTAKGVRAVELASGDRVVSALAPRRDSDLLAATAAGAAKRIPVTELRVQSRAGKGRTIVSRREKVGGVVALLEIHPGDRIVWELSSGRLATTSVRNIAQDARRAASHRVVPLRKGVEVVDVHPARGAPAGAAGPEASGLEAPEREAAGASRSGSETPGGSFGQEVLDL